VPSPKFQLYVYDPCPPEARPEKVTEVFKNSCLSAPAFACKGEGAGVGIGTGVGLGIGVGSGVGTGVGVGEGSGVGVGSGIGVGVGVGVGVGAGAGIVLFKFNLFPLNVLPDNAAVGSEEVSSLSLICI